MTDRDALDFVTEAYRHCKPIAASSDGARLLEASPGVLPDSEGNGNGNGGDAAAEGVRVTSDAADAEFARAFIADLGRHRFWGRSRRNRFGGAYAGVDETRGRAPVPQAEARLV